MAGMVFDGLGILVGEMVFLSPQEAYALLATGKAILLDIRDEFETNGRTFTVPAVIHIPHQRPQEEFLALPKDRPLIVADCVGQLSKEKARLLRSYGYEVAVLNGGMIDWERNGMPVAIDRDAELVGSCVCQMRPRRVFQKKNSSLQEE